MAKKMNLTLVKINTIIFSSCLHAGELTFGWNKINETGNIRDMEFMPDYDYFIMSTLKELQSGITTIDISTLPAGTYFLRYYCGSAITINKIICTD